MALYTMKVSEMKKVLGFHHDDDELRGVIEYTDHRNGEDKLKLHIASAPIPEHYIGTSPWTNEQGICLYLSTARGCYYCCDTCNYNTHRCGGCGEDLTHYGLESATLDKHENCT